MANSIPVETASSQGSSTIVKLVEALGARTCTPDEFLHEVLRRESDEPELAWEVLAQLDQYYRRRKIPHDVFISVKARLRKQSQQLGSGAGPVPKAEDGAEPLAPEEAIVRVRPNAGPAPPAPAPAPIPALVIAAAPAPEFVRPLPPMSAERVFQSRPAAPAPAPAPVMLATPPAPTASKEEPAPSPARTLRGEPRTGDLLCGRYRIMGILRRDSAGTLLEAVDERRVDVPEIRQRLAIRLMEVRGGRERAVLQRLYRLQSLSHPGIVRIFDIDEEQGELFLAMEWLSGMSLQQFIDASGGARLNARTARVIVRSLASALAYAHSCDVAHGNVCAANVFISETGDVRLRGFEMQSGMLADGPASDRLSFAWLAYELLASRHVAAGDGTARRRAGSADLRRPESVTREEWPVLRDTLLGKDTRSGNVLTQFAGDHLADTRLTALNAFVREPARTGFGYMAGGALAAAVALFAFFYVDWNGLLNSGTGEASATAVQTDVQAAAPARIETIVAAAPVVEVEATPTPVEPEARPTRSRIDIASNSVVVPADQPFARVLVRRRGNLDGVVAFRWWTETGSAQLNRDFLRIEPRTQIIADGDSSVELLVPLLEDPAQREERTFYVKIDQPGSGATLGERTLTQVTITPLPAATEAEAEAPAGLPEEPQVAAR